MIEALGVGDVILETMNINSLAPISTPAQLDDGAFRGIQRSNVDILAFRVHGAGSVLDNLEFTRQSNGQPVPEPSLELLLGISLIGLVGVGAVRKIS